MTRFLTIPTIFFGDEHVPDQPRVLFLTPGACSCWSLEIASAFARHTIEHKVDLHILALSVATCFCVSITFCLQSSRAFFERSQPGHDGSRKRKPTYFFLYWASSALIVRSSAARPSASILISSSACLALWIALSKCFLISGSTTAPSGRI